MLRLRAVKVTNYKCFREEASFELSPKVTYILGPNNSGKTTLLEAIQAPNTAYPHRSPRTVPRFGDSPRHSASRIQLSFAATSAWLREFLLASVREFGVRGEPNDVNEIGYLERILARSVMFFDLVIDGDGNYVGVASWDPRDLPPKTSAAFAVYRSQPGSNSFAYRRAAAELVTWPHELGQVLYGHFYERIFRFRAERSRALSGHVDVGLDLTPDAGNLVQVLSNLQGRNELFQKYLDYVRRVLPEIRSIGVVPVGRDTTAIRVWFFAGQREDFAMPLEQAGSGVPNVLSLLYTITMSPQPRLIMIDELSAFLHPGATRELLRVMREFPDHQYIVSSHQPIALDELDDVAMVLLARDTDGATTVRSIDPTKADDQQAVLATVGASLSDVFSADRVLWVEGPTETRVFRTVAARIGLPRGAVILPIVHTGDLEGKQVELAAEVYRRLTESGALLPPAIAMVFDDEGRKAEAKKELAARLKPTRVEFLPVRMIENVFLDPNLVHEFLHRDVAHWAPDSIAKDYSATAIDAYWNDLDRPHRYNVDFKRETDPARWVRETHGANVLGDTFEHFTDNRLAYNKVVHGPQLTKLAEETNPTLLNVIESLLRSLIAS